jgi:hypothetical protein
MVAKTCGRLINRLQQAGIIAAGVRFGTQHKDTFVVYGYIYHTGWLFIAQRRDCYGYRASKMSPW